LFCASRADGITLSICNLFIRAKHLEFYIHFTNLPKLNTPSTICCNSYNNFQKCNELVALLSVAIYFATTKIATQNFCGNKKWLPNLKRLATITHGEKKCNHLVSTNNSN
jgi:hypothetical protein